MSELKPKNKNKQTKRTRRRTGAGKDTREVKEAESTKVSNESYVKN